MLLGVWQEGAVADAPEHIQAARDHVAYCKACTPQGAADWGVEYKLRLGAVAGYVDYYAEAEDTLHVVELKAGEAPVEAYENWQLLAYASALVERPSLARVDRVTLKVYQPFCYRLKSHWSLNREELAAYTKVLKSRALEALSDASAYRTGSHCYKCPCLLTCPATRQMLPQLLEVTSRRPREEATVEELATYYTIAKRAAEAVKNIYDILHDQLLQLAKKGTPIPGYRISQASGREDWTTTPEQIAQLAELCGVELFKRTPITPTQARSAGVPEALMAAYVQRKSGSYSLKAINPSKDFS
jgi:hypothetical protein